MINGELTVDNFAGGGGASTGIELATGISADCVTGVSGWKGECMERLTFKVHDGGIFVKGSDVKTFDVEDEIMHTGNAIRKLAEYEDLEEQGLLPKPPCKVDSEVWYIDKYADLDIGIVRGVVDGYLWFRTCGFALNVVWDKPIMGHFGYKRKEVPFSEIGKTVFLTQSEAEEALKGMEARNE